MAEVMPRQASARAGAAHAGVVRKDVQALRALAVAMVIVYHFWPPALPGGFVGVDIFFVISGYLITGGLYRRPPTGLGGLTDFWARRVLRLIPAAALTLATSLIVVALFLPHGEWGHASRHALSSMFYVENWRLVSEATDYLAADGAESPFQHFWSLSVEEQYYLTWPILVCGLAVLARRRHWPAQVVLGAGVAAVTTSSLVYGLMITWSAPTVAYFSTPARIWELGLGGILAIWGSGRPWPAGATHVRTLLMWAGVSLMLASAVLIGDDTPFPGWAALAPTLGAVAFLAAGDPHGPGSLRRLTHAAPVQLVGNTSYALYLWHWPALVLVPLCLGLEPSLWLKLLLLPALVVLAWASTTGVENPLRATSRTTSVRRRGLAILALASAAVVAVALAMLAQVARVTEASSDAVAELTRGTVERTCLGAGSMDASLDCPAASELVTTPEFTKTDLSESIQVGKCLNWPPFGELVRCSRGDTAAPGARVALFGNSHAGHWQPAVQAVAKARGWQLDTYVVGVCQPTLEPVSARGEPLTARETSACNTLQSGILDDLTGSDYDLVVMSTMDEDNDAGVYSGTLDRLTGAGLPVLVIRDTPAPMDLENETPFCVSFHLDDPATCAGTPDEWIRRDPLAEAAAQADPDLVSIVDLNHYLCTDTTCPAVIGGVIVYADYNHMSATFNASLAPYLEPHMVELLDATS